MLQRQRWEVRHCTGSGSLQSRTASARRGVVAVLLGSDFGRRQVVQHALQLGSVLCTTSQPARVIVIVMVEC